MDVICISAMTLDPVKDPKDPAYRPPLDETMRFPSSGPVAHPNLKEALYQSLSMDQTVADIGCGPGPFEYFRYCARFIAFDTFEPDTQEGMKPGDEFICGRLEEFPLESESCDAVVMGFILEHVPDPGRFIAEADRVLKPGGYCYIAVPNYRSLEDRCFRLATKVAGSTRGPHIQKFTFKNFQTLVSANSSMELLTWHHLKGSFLWMMHPKLRPLRKPVLNVLSAVKKVGPDLLAGSNLQFIFQKPVG